MEVLRVENLGLKIGEKTILEDISFALEKGQLLAVCGPNGAGKSCLLRILKGLQKPLSGRIFLEGKDCTKSEKTRLLKMGLVFQDADVQTIGETVERDIAFGPENLRLSKEEVKKATDRAIEFFNLESFRKQGPETLSGGERRKLVIAGVLAMDPQIVMLDEPFANLDYRGVQTVLKAILKLKENGKTVLLVSHEVEKYIALCDRALIINGGKTVFLGSAEEAVKHFKGNGIYCPKGDFSSLSYLEEES
ncbi:MAG: energy-coupling factor ABC transporter ATP-binding protein [Sphaerochaetaceae bacterium]|nr:energy-coupling factor ABC transporter ATP-binding protein [Sphaerochaetaceae bacterium]